MPSHSLPGSKCQLQWPCPRTLCLPSPPCPADAFRAVQKIIHINAELILFVLVPPLLFMAGLDINPHVLRKQIWGALWLAGPGVVLSTCLTAASSYLAYGDWGWGWTTCFMFGALVSATDPVAVVALLHDLGAPESFAVLIDGEALLNDGSASVLFFVFKDFAQGEHKTWLQVSGRAARPVFCGTGIGSSDKTFSNEIFCWRKSGSM